MRLFIFEGQAEERVFKTLKYLFMDKEHEPVCVFKNNIYALYSRLKKHSVFEDQLQEGNSEIDTVSVLNEILLEKNDHTLEEYVNNGVVFAEIHLFFDYDFHEKHGTLQENNEHLQKMLNYFSNETENGKLYINYPMIEAYRYVKDIPDNNYVNYVVKRADCKNFKDNVANFSKLKIDHFVIVDRDLTNETKREKILPDLKDKWKGIIPMNVKKANYICSGRYEIPQKKSDIEQSKIFNNQLAKYVYKEQCQVSVLSAFPLFLYEYYKADEIGLINITSDYSISEK